MKQPHTNKRDLHQQARLSRLSSMSQDLSLHDVKTASILRAMIEERQKQVQQQSRKEATA